MQSQSGVKGTPLYTAPEIPANEKYSNANDVYTILYKLFMINFFFYKK